MKKKQSNKAKAIELLQKIVLKYNEKGMENGVTKKFCFNPKYTSIQEIEDFLKSIDEQRTI